MSHSKTEIRNAADMQEFLSDPRGFRRVAVQGMDLQDYEKALSRLDLSGFWFLGCHLPPGLAEQAARQRAVVLPELDGFPFRPFRTTLYTVEELFDAAEHDDCLDSRIFRTVYKRGQRRVAKLDTVVARRIHDSSISEALRWLLEARAPKRKGRDRVAIMGSHNVPRRDPSYAQVARLGYRLTRRGFFVMTGAARA